MPGQLTVDLDTERAMANNKTVALSPRHAKILDALNQAYPQPATIDFMLGLMREQNDHVSGNGIQVAICQMRPKLADIGVRIFSAGKQRYQLHVGDVSDIPQFDEDDLAILRRAMNVLKKARKVVG